MRVVVLFSGGKDSTYAAWLLHSQGWEVSSLLTVQPDFQDSRMFHIPGVEWTRLQAEAMGFRHDIVGSHPETSGMAQLEKALSALKQTRGISGIVTGAVASDYQKSRFDAMCERVGIKSFSPLWHKSPKLIVNDLVQAGFRILLTGVGAAGLDESWLGRSLDIDSWKQLEKLSSKWGFHLAGEGGEYESFVYDAPFFEKRIVIDKTRRVWDSQRGHLVIESAMLSEKTGC